MTYEHLIGKKCTFLMKPSLMRDWIVIRETKNCLVLKKETDKEERYHLSKKLIMEAHTNDDAGKS